MSVRLLMALLCCGTQALAAVYVVAQNHPQAGDDNPGDAARPFRTISAAMRVAAPGDTIEVGDGVYREEVVWPGQAWEDTMRRIVLTAAEGAHPVISGADVAKGPWEPNGARPGVYTTRWDAEFVDMVFVDDRRLEQAGLQGNPRRAAGTNGFQWQKQRRGEGVADMRPGSFYYDADSKRLNVWLADGGSPADHTVEVPVRDVGLQVAGTWTVRGLEVMRIMDGFWPREQAVAVTGNQCVVERCKITDNGFVGLIVSGQDCIVRGSEIARNGLDGFTSNYGFRMLIEGNDFHDNAWRGDVKCLACGNKWVLWREARFLRNHFHDEATTSLWCDIGVSNALIAENLFERCGVGIYFEISRWGVIANNVIRDCGRGIWVYASDVLVAHNIVDRCGEGITVSGYPRTCEYMQSTKETSSEPALMAVRNVLVADNILIDCPGSYIGITENDPFGWGNWSDYNALVWTLPAYHRTGLHINFLSGWNALYGSLPIWRMERHCDTHSVVVDPGLAREVENESPYVGLAAADVLADAGLVDRQGGDYRLKPDSPLRGRGISIPAVLYSPYVPGKGDEILSRAWARTLLAAAPGRPAVYGGDGGHYRLQPLPATRGLVDIDAAGPGTPGLNGEWLKTGAYPRFDPSAGPETADDLSYAVAPDNLVADPGFDLPFAPTEGADARSWVSGGLHTFQGMACANLAPGQVTAVVARQKLGTVAADSRFLLYVDATATSLDPGLAAVGECYLAVGEGLTPIGERIRVATDPGRARAWASYATEFMVEAAYAGQDLYAVLAARVEGTPDGQANPAALVRWDNVWVLRWP